MIENILLQHKSERDAFISRSYILREELRKASEFLDSDLIKIITGSRRAGKSVFSILLLKDKNFAYLNLDDENILKIKDYDEIVKAIFEVYPQAKFVLFDEIHNLKDWELFVNKLQRRGFNLVLTGSNARLLGKELATTLTGRYIPIEIFPFSFKEFLEANNFKIEKEAFTLSEVKGKALNYLDTYLKYGGFPEIVVKNLDPKIYLETLFDAILFRDIVKRYKVRAPEKIYDLATYLISNFSSMFSFTKLRDILGFRSTNTIEKYLAYLEESYLFFSLNRFSFKVKEQIKTAKKIYLVDNGFILAKSFQSSQNLGKLMENLVFVEIIRRGYKSNRDVFYYRTSNSKEVDFILKKGIKIERLIQVCYGIEDLETKKREGNSLIEASRELTCDDLLVITWDYEKEEGIKDKKIRFLPLWKWLLFKT